MASDLEDRESELADAMAEVADEARLERARKVIEGLRRRGVVRATYDLESPYGHVLFPRYDEETQTPD